MASSTAARRRAQFANSNSHVRFNEQARNGFSSDDDDDEDSGAEEDRLERQLSARTGETKEASSGGGAKRAPTEEEIAAEYDKAPRKKKPRPTLDVKDLMGAEGLIRVPIEFKAIVTPNNHNNKNKKNNKVEAAAAYSRNLVSAYQSFCFDLFSGMAFEDVLLRIESLGSKKEVKTFLQSMRQDVQNSYVEKLYGKEKAAQILEELDYGLKQQQELEEQGGDVQALEEESPLELRTVERPVTRMQAQPAATTAGPSTTTMADSTATGKQGYKDDDEEEEEADFGDAEPQEEIETRPSNATALPPRAAAAAAAANKGDTNEDDDDDLLQEMATGTTLSINADAAAISKVNNRRRLVLEDDSSDEEEATFDDDDEVELETQPKADVPKEAANLEIDSEDKHDANPAGDKAEVPEETEVEDTESAKDKDCSGDMVGVSAQESEVEDMEFSKGMTEGSLHTAPVDKTPVADEPEEPTAVDASQSAEKEPTGIAQDEDEVETSLMNDLTNLAQQTPPTQFTVNGSTQDTETATATTVPTQFTQLSEDVATQAVATQASESDTIVPTMTAPTQLDSPLPMDSDNDSNYTK
jgi:hypothetical protein